MVFYTEFTMCGFLYRVYNVWFSALIFLLNFSRKLDYFFAAKLISKYGF